MSKKPGQLHGRFGPVFSARATGLCGVFFIRPTACVADATGRRYVWMAMQPLKARVHNGRLVLDEPTDLPEGEEVELVAIDDVLVHGGDDLDDEERAALHAELRASMAEAKAGKLIDADDVLAELRAAR